TPPTYPPYPGLAPRSARQEGAHPTCPRCAWGLPVTRQDAAPSPVRTGHRNGPFDHDGKGTNPLPDEPRVGIEPTPCRLRDGCSATEPTRRDGGRSRTGVRGFAGHCLTTRP